MPVQQVPKIGLLALGVGLGGYRTLLEGKIGIVWSPQRACTDPQRNISLQGTGWPEIFPWFGDILVSVDPTNAEKILTLTLQ